MSTTPTTESFSQHEDVQLANAYILVCENRKIRKDSAIFWKIIADDFNDKKSSDDMRDCETLKNRWNIIDKNVSKYLRYLGIAATQLGTGYVPNDRIKLAKQLYRSHIAELEGKESLGEEFTLEHCYDIMVKHPKWYPREHRKNLSEDLVVYSNNRTGSSSTDPTHPVRPESTRTRKLKEEKRAEKRKIDSLWDKFSNYFEAKMEAEKEAQALKERKAKMKAKLASRYFDLQMLSINTAIDTDPYVISTLEKFKKAACDRLNKESIEDITQW